MKSKGVIVVVVAAAVAGIIFYSFRGNNSVGYAAQVQSVRDAKDAFMRSSDESPFGDNRKDFKELKYFPVDPSYRINARLVSNGEKKQVNLGTSDGLEKSFVEYGYAEFEWDHVSCRLLILEITEDGPFRGTLFLAFADNTSANETYGAGRYLDVKKVPGASSIMLDFNEAYNPYCAYSEHFSCPFPPKENLLKVAIRAGEMNYQH